MSWIPRAEFWGTVPSKIFGGGDGDAFVPPKFQKYLIKYRPKSLQCFPLFALALVLCVYCIVLKLQYYVGNCLLFRFCCYLFRHYVRLRPLDGVLRAAARLIGGVPKFGHIGEFMRGTLHWLPVRQRIFYRVSTIAWRCILGVAPAYLSELFVLSSSCPG